MAWLQLSFLINNSTIDSSHLFIYRMLHMAGHIRIEAFCILCRSAIQFRDQCLQHLQREFTLPPSFNGLSGADVPSLAQLVTKIERQLPLELQRLIYDDVSGLFQVLASCSLTLSGYDRQDEMSDTFTTSHVGNPLRNSTVGNTIKATFTDV